MGRRSPEAVRKWVWRLSMPSCSRSAMQRRSLGKWWKLVRYVVVCCSFFFWLEFLISKHLVAEWRACNDSCVRRARYPIPACLHCLPALVSPHAARSTPDLCSFLVAAVVVRCKDASNVIQAEIRASRWQILSCRGQAARHHLTESRPNENVESGGRKPRSGCSRRGKNSSYESSKVSCRLTSPMSLITVITGA